MTNYTRGTIWADGQQLTDDALNDEFNRIQAVINGGLELSNFLPGEVEKALVINAGDDRFQTGGLDRAERVAGAVAEAVASADEKTVWVPRGMFGYAEDAGWAAGIFNVAVLMVREGALTAGHDPIAYGSKIDDVTEDDTPVFDVCVTQAEGSGGGANPGSAELVVTLPGDYELGTDVVLPTPQTIGYSRRSAVVYTGAGEVRASGGQEFLGTVSEVELATNLEMGATAPTAIPALATQTFSFTFATTALAVGTPLQFWITVQEDALPVSDALFIANGFVFGNFTITWVSFSDDGTSIMATVDVTNDDAGNPHNGTVTLFVRTLRDTPIGS